MSRVKNVPFKPEVQILRRTQTDANLRLCAYSTQRKDIFSKRKASLLALERLYEKKRKILKDDMKIDVFLHYSNRGFSSFSVSKNTKAVFFYQDA